MKKILICLPSKYYDKYIELDAFKELKKKFNVSFLLNKNKWKNSNYKPKDKYYYNLDKKQHTFFLRTIRLFLAANKNLSKTFRFNLKRWYPNLKDYIKIEKTIQKDFDSPNNINHFKIFLKYFYKAFWKRVIFFFLSNKIIFHLYKNLILSRVKLNNDILEVVEKIKPDLIIYTTHCYEPETFMIPKIAKDMGAKTLFLVDNWDNVSCKTVFYNKPDFLGVWGEQSRNHAEKIQSIQKKNIFLIGSPKFDNYLLLRKKKMKNIFKHKYVLFFGIVELYNDIEVLRLLDKEISENKIFYKDLKIVFRPHPSRPNIFLHSKKIRNFKNIIFDPNMDNYLKTKNKKFLENKKLYFEKLLSNSLFNIGGLTTVTIESLMFKKKQIFYCYEEKDNITDPKSLFENSLHFEKIEKVSALTKSKSLNLVIKNFREMYKNKNYNKINKNLDNEINYFYYISNKTYSKKLLFIVKKIFLKI